MISNPYAKKKVAPHVVAAPNSGNEALHQQHAAPPAPAGTRVSASSISIPHIPARRATTFSQAFDSMDNDNHIDDPAPPGPQAQGGSAAAADPPHDYSSTINNNNDKTNPRPPGKNLSERDHHVFLQHQPHVLYVSTKQRGNGVLDCIRNVPLQYHTMVPDYILGRTSCALFLSLRYHNLYPEYIFRRIAALQSDFTLRVLLVLVDVDDNAAVLLQLNKAAVTHNLTLILAWSEEEAARYLETYKALDGRDATAIQKAKDTTHHLADQVTDFLTACKSINKTDAASVLTQFGSVRAAMAATPDELGLVSGLGQVKVKRLYEAWHKPFSSKASRERPQKRNEAQEEVKTTKKKKAAPLAAELDEGDRDDDEEELELEDME